MGGLLCHVITHRITLPNTPSLIHQADFHTILTLKRTSYEIILIFRAVIWDVKLNKWEVHLGKESENQNNMNIEYRTVKLVNDCEIEFSHNFSSKKTCVFKIFLNDSESDPQHFQKD